MRVRSSIWLIFFLLTAVAFAQERRSGKKPVLIRDDPAEKETVEAPVQLDPRAALDNLRIGDFYLKKDNYKAAEERYREAIKYNPKLVEAYQKLVRTLEKQKNYGAASQVCEQFVSANPDSKEAPEFQQRAKGLASKTAR
jgi:tetratricopeptide (TPR) repeat protein